VLWGDGRHDDTAALNAWFRGGSVFWAETGKSVGAEIAGRRFRLSGPIYVVGGTGRRLEDFRMVWPTTGERMTGGAIIAGEDPNRPPVTSRITKMGGDGGEGVPFAGPDPKPTTEPEGAASCLVS
jgi:hypothetical protein